MSKKKKYSIRIKKREKSRMAKLIILPYGSRVWIPHTRAMTLCTCAPIVSYDDVLGARRKASVHQRQTDHLSLKRGPALYNLVKKTRS